jgi:hypothetical protein
MFLLRTYATFAIFVCSVAPPIAVLQQNVLELLIQFVIQQILGGGDYAYTRFIYLVCLI